MSIKYKGKLQPLVVTKLPIKLWITKIVINRQNQRKCFQGATFSQGVRSNLHEKLMNSWHMGG